MSQFAGLERAAHRFGDRVRSEVGYEARAIRGTHDRVGVNVVTCRKRGLCVHCRVVIEAGEAIFATDVNRSRDEAWFCIDCAVGRVRQLLEAAKGGE